MQGEKKESTYHSLHIDHVWRCQHGLDHELMFAFFIRIILERLQHNWKKKGKQKLTSEHFVIVLASFHYLSYSFSFPYTFGTIRETTK